MGVNDQLVVDIEADLNEFFANDSRVSDQQLLSVTYVAEIDGHVVAFFSVKYDLFPACVNVVSDNAECV